MEHVTLHLLYSRFWNMALFDLGLVPNEEPYKKRTAHGLILAEGGVKMSKSKGNVINPLEVADVYGADALRLYIMFMGPFDQAIAWDKNGILGTRRFLEKAIKIVSLAKAESEDDATLRLVAKVVHKVSADIEDMGFNTAIAAMMEFSNKVDAAKMTKENAKFL
ncbi:MAG: class I tRNA ligase family protein [Candidatus Paceibacterota bacterium]